MHGPVTAFEPNEFGIIGMVGNVSEWCLDIWSSHRRSIPGVGDGIGRPNPNDNRRVFRGGNWFFGFPKCRSAFREPHPPSSMLSGRGLRVVRPLLRSAAREIQGVRS